MPRSQPNLPSCKPARRSIAPGTEVPEKSWAYKFTKKHFFHDFGAYKDLKN
jgi:hypothetical protein